MPWDGRREACCAIGAEKYVLVIFFSANYFFMRGLPRITADHRGSPRIRKLDKGSGGTLRVFYPSTRQDPIKTGFFEELIRQAIRQERQEASAYAKIRLPPRARGRCPTPPGRVKAKSTKTYKKRDKPENRTRAESSSEGRATPHAGPFREGGGEGRNVVAHSGPGLFDLEVHYLAHAAEDRS